MASSVARGTDGIGELSTGRAIAVPRRTAMGESGSVPAPDTLTAQAALVPDKPAVIDPEGERLTFAELEARPTGSHAAWRASASPGATR